ncbi:MAG: hypothetical protein ACP5E4_00625 [Candidatus Aenigmatarchaeota archaeon]
MKKGLAIDLTGTMLIAIVGIGILILFVSGSLSKSVNQGFCFLANGIGIEPRWCEHRAFARETVDLEPLTKEDLAIELAAHSINCWMEAIKPKEKENFVCYEIFLKKHPGPVTEEDMTRVMEEEGGCEILQNFYIITESGTVIEYPGDCGDRDEIDWRVFDKVIDQQSLVRIEYDTASNKILIKA